MSLSKECGAGMPLVSFVSMGGDVGEVMFLYMLYVATLVPYRD